jgi:hypothetical protein
MLDLRKLFLALVVLVVATATVNAQLITPVSCVAQAAGTPSIRAEGVAELVGDVLIICNGGVPTQFGVNVPQVNLQVFTSPSINVTSRLLAGDWTEAMLFIDEPLPAGQRICGSTNAPEGNPGGALPVVPGVCARVEGTGNGIGTYNITTGTNPGFYRLNAFQGRRVGANSIIWQGIPFDPPGTQTTRVLRITNVRVNASQLGVPAGAQASVSLVVSTSASGVLNPIALPITNPAPTVAIAQNSLTFAVGNPRTFLQCESVNPDWIDANFVTPVSLIELRYDELFPTVFRRRNQAPTSADTPVAQDTLGFPFQTESGFFKDGSSTPNWPEIITSTSGVNRGRVRGTISGTLGLADHGTRLIARFQNVPAGVSIFVQTTAQLRLAGLTTVSGSLQLVQADPNCAGPYSPASANTAGYTQVTIVGGTGSACWEVLTTDTTAFERAVINVVVAYKANTAANLPGLGTASANGNLAPLSTQATAGGAGVAIPRFIDTAANRTIFTINACVTNLLFPFVTNQAGFDTGIAIANTSKDPFGTARQTGACTVNFYGVIGGSSVCLSYPSPSITGGEHFAWTLSNGGAVQATAGFQGYIIAQCAFQYGHGYAFISDVGVQRIAQGYLALVMDDALAPSRTKSKSEVLGH